MDFARPHIHKPGPTTTSNIRPLPIEPKPDNKIDSLLIEAANRATYSLFQTTPPPPLPSSSSSPPPTTTTLTNPTPQNEIANCTLYPERTCPRTPLIKPNSLVVIFESFDNLTFTYVTPGAVFHNRNGQFRHDDFLNKPFGSQIRSSDNGGAGFVYVLRPTAELWCRSLNHRTQIVHELDASFVCARLEIVPGDVVLESGTGSGAMSHALLRCVAPRGRVHTFEFNKMRVESAREEFENNQVHGLVTVHHRDVCGKDGGKGGFNLGNAIADAIFLDLPEPWLAVPHAAFALKPNKKLCTYSPCMEQTQKTVTAMTRCGFHSITTAEVRLREYMVDEVVLEGPPRKKLVLGGASAKKTAAAVAADNATHGNGAGGGCSKADEKGDAASSQNNDAKTNDIPQSSSGGGADVISNNERNGGDGDNKRRKLVCARPFSTMRGHTAFLTFATASLVPQPVPTTVGAAVDDPTTTTTD